jgi:hypothetical protein
MSGFGAVPLSVWEPGEGGSIANLQLPIGNFQLPGRLAIPAKPSRRTS